MTDSEKKMLAASVSMHGILGQINKLIASEEMRERFIGSRQRKKLKDARDIVQGVINYWEER
jgi:hypothetical protein